MIDIKGVFNHYSITHWQTSARVPQYFWCIFTMAIPSSYVARLESFIVSFTAFTE